MIARAAPRVDLFFIGAPKCGTTWLTRRLGQHPGLCMPADEIHYYSRHYGRGPEWYAPHFAAATEGQKLGENSNSYLTEPDALARIAAEQPDARILAVLRDPVQRAYSSYGMQVDRGRADGDIARYLDPARSPRPHILTNGRYAEMLAPWYDRFPAERIMVQRFKEIRTEPAELVRTVLRFMELDPDLVRPDVAARENARKSAGVPGGLKRALWWARPVLDRPPLRGIVRGPFGQRLQSLLSRPKHYPPLTPEIERRLRDYYAADIQRLEKMTGASYSDWLTGAPAAPPQRGGA